MTEIPLNEVLHFEVTTSHPSTGAVTDADSTPTWSIFEEDTDTPLLANQNFTKRTSLTGDYRGVVTLSTASGFEIGKWYSIIATATVNGVTGKKVVETFRIVAEYVGSGTRTVTITVNDGAAAIQSANVRVTKGAESYLSVTNSSGQVVFNLDDGTWVVSITAPAYTFAGASLVVDGTEAVTYSMTAVAISPSAVGLTTGFSTVYSELGVIEVGITVSCKVKKVGSATGLVLDDTVRTAVSNGSGVVQFTNLFKGVTYAFYRNVNKVYIVTIPADAGLTYELPSFIGSP